MLARARQRPAARSRRSIDDIGSLIRGYLIEGKPAFRLRETPTVAQAIEAIHDAGGVAIWAHPFWDISDAEEVLVEHRPLPRARRSTASRPSTSPTRASRPSCWSSAATQLGLLTTGSADFHGPENRQFSRFLAFDTYGLEPNLGPIAG